MSYDLHLVKPAPGKSVEDALEVLFAEDEDEDEPAPHNAEAQALQRRLVAALVAKHPALEPFAFDFATIGDSLGLSAEEAARQFQHVELNGPEEGNGIQITVDGAAATITVPYWHRGDGARAVFAEIWDYLEIFGAEGFVAFDGQLERVIDLRADREAALAAYLATTATIPR
jgi:hypothetical protein